MRFVRLFKIPRHFRQQLVAGNADVDREAKLSVNALPQPVRRQHRRAVKSRRAGHVDPRLVDGKLLHERRIFAQHGDQTSRGCDVKLIIRLHHDQIRTFFHRLAQRLAGLDAEFLCRAALGQNDAVARFLSPATTDGTIRRSKPSPRTHIRCAAVHDKNALLTSI